MTAFNMHRKLPGALALLRIFIGWHFLYEGIVKVYNPDWTSFGYLASAQGPLSPVFGALTAEGILPWVDTLNWAALLFVGFTFILGVFERAGALVGMGLLALYYLAHPSFPGLDQLNAEGSSVEFDRRVRVLDDQIGRHALIALADQINGHDRSFRQRRGVEGSGNVGVGR